MCDAPEVAALLSDEPSKCSQSLLFSIFDGIRDPIYVVDRADRLVFLNDALCRLIGGDRRELLGRSRADILQLEPTVTDSGGSNRLQGRLFQAHRAALGVSVETSEFSDAGERFWVGIVQSHISDSPLQSTQIEVPIQDELAEENSGEPFCQPEDVLSSIYNGVQLAICVIDVARDGTFRYVGLNPLSEQLTGISSRAIRGKTPQEFFGEILGAQLEQNYRRCREAGTAISYEECLTLNGQEVWGLTTLSPLWDAGGNLYRIICTTVDLSNLKRVEQALEQSESKFQKLCDNVPGMIYRFQISPTGVRSFSHVSSGCIEIWGLTAEQLEADAEQALHRIHANDRTGYERSLLASAATLTAWHWEGRVVLPGDELRWIQGAARPERQSDGTIVWDGVITDVTPLKQAEAALHRLNTELENRIETRTAELLASQQRLSLLVQQTPLAVIEWDTDYCVTDWNPAAERIFGYSREEAIGQYFTFLVPEPIRQEIGELMQGLLRDRQTAKLFSRSINQNVTRTGELITCEWHNMPLVTTDGEVIGAASLAVDISDRERAEQELLATKNLYQQILDAIPDLILCRTADANSSIIYANRAFRQYYNQTLEQLQSDANALMGDRENPPSLHGAAAHVSSEAIGVEEPLTRHDGEVRLFNTVKVAIRDEDGHVVQTVGISHDMTEQKQAEAVLREQEQLLRSVYEGVEHQIFVVDVSETGDFRYIGWNSVTTRKLGKSVLDLSDRTPEGLFGPDEGAKVRQRYSECVHKKRALNYEECLTYPTEDTWFLTTLNPLRSENGKIYRLVGTAVDITDRKRAEQALSRQARLTAFRADVDSALTRSNDLPSILQSCTDAVVQHLDAAFARIWTLNAEANVLELQASSGMYTHIDGPHARVPVGKFKIGLIAEERRPHLTNDVLKDPRVGDRAWAEREGMVAFAGYPLMVDNQMLGVLAMFSRTPLDQAVLKAMEFAGDEIALGIKRKQAEAALQKSELRLRQQTQQLEQALHDLQRTQSQMVQSEKMSSLGQLVAGVAHEINNPVNFIYGNLSHANEYTQDLLRLVHLFKQHHPNPHPIVQEEMDAIDLDFLMADLPKLIASMRVGADRIQKIVASLRTFSRMDEAEFKPVDIHEGIDSTLMILQSRLKARGDQPEILVERHYGKLPLVKCYAGQLNQVFMNLLSNAIDALEEVLESDSATKPLNLLTPVIRITTELQDSDQVCIRIADNGPGIPDHALPRLFDPFFTTKPVGKGTGMGLSISYQIVTEKHHGSLQCHSRLGEGTEFVITIPNVTVEAKQPITRFG